ncbi:CD225/dispanin family protein [Luteimonas aquatica]|uniref:CD225/dispanin family protein n=1 Tax=Luteimonas aquatica TaxID=450364 RepID=UPI001F563CF7|nr:CD225/dispanin family protein [Luteimonas aquatica]
MSTLPPSPPPAPGQSFGDTPSLPPGSVPNYLAWSIIATVLGACLCCPLGLIGIVGIVFSSKVNGLLQRGDLEGAKRASKNAKTWAWVATALAIIGLLINVYFYMTGGPAAYQQWIQQMQSMQQQ